MQQTEVQNTLQYNGLSFFNACTDGVLPVAVLIWHQSKASGLDIVNTPDSEGVLPLHWASYYGRLPLVRFLVSQGAKLDAPAGQDDSAALHWAAGSGKLDIIDFLLQSGANPTLRDGKGYLPATHAVQYGKTLALHMLVSRTENYPLGENACDKWGHSLLHWAAYKGQLATLKYLIDVRGQTCCVNVLDETRRSPLHWAAREGRTDACRYLIEKGAIQNIRDVDDCTPLMWATQREHFETQQFLSSKFDSQAAPSTKKNVKQDWKTYHFMKSRPWQLRRLVVSVGLVLTYYFVICRFLPTWFALIIPSFFLLFPAATSILIVAKLCPPPPGWSGPKMCLDTKTRNLGICGAFWALIFCILWEFYTSSVMRYASEHNTRWLVATQVSLVVGIIALIYIKVVDPGLASAKTQEIDLDSRAFQLTELKKFDELNSDVFDMDTLQPKPRRAHLCEQIDQRVIRLDHFNIFLDSVIAANNHVAYMVFLLCFTIIHLTILMSAYRSVIPASTEDKGLITNLYEMSFCRLFGNVVNTGLPYMWDLQTVKIVVTPVMSKTAVWCCIYNFVITVAFIMHLVQQVLYITVGTTSFETSHMRTQHATGKRAKRHAHFNEGFVHNWLSFCAKKELLLNAIQ